eukprot:6994575-Alexandrium_andersonii.AAC.1
MLEGHAEEGVDVGRGAVAVAHGGQPEHDAHVAKPERRHSAPLRGDARLARGAARQRQVDRRLDATVEVVGEAAPRLGEHPLVTAAPK